jgi:hypothetical protein
MTHNLFRIVQESIDYYVIQSILTVQEQTKERFFFFFFFFFTYKYQYIITRMGVRP